MQIKISTEPLDVLNPECLMLGFFSDERPPRGPCGFADWRLNGLISNLLAAGRIRGALRENVLIETGGRIPPPKVLLHGLGPFHELSYERLHQAGTYLARTAIGIRCRELAFDIPAAPRAELDITQMTEALIRGFFDTVLSGTPDIEKTLCPCLLADESYFQKALLGLHRYKLSVRDRVPVDILIKRDNHPALI
jgi:hypothetical protein